MSVIEEKMQQILALDISDPISFRYYYGSEHEQIGQEQRYCMDYRLFHAEEYMKYAITTEMSIKLTNEVLGYTTFYILPKEVYQKIYFWRYDRVHDELYKTYLKDSEDQIGKALLILAFGKLKQNDDYQKLFYKNRAFKHYMRFYEILQSDISVLGEPTGVYRLDQQPTLLEMERLKPDDVGGFEHLGETFHESRSALQLTKYLGLQLQPDLYHAETLGAIYMKLLNE